MRKQRLDEIEILVVTQLMKGKGRIQARRVSLQGLLPQPMYFTAVGEPTLWLCLV